MKSVLFISISCLLTSFLRHTVRADQIPRFYTVAEVNGKPKREGHLTCMTFGSSGCKLVCEIFCDLYGCESQGFCVGPTCFCGERYEIFTKKYDAEQYQQISSTILWFYKFDTNDLSRKVIIALKETEDVWNIIDPLIRNPAYTGFDIKNEILLQRPDWHIVQELKPVRHGYVQDFVDSNLNKYDYDHFQQYIDMMVEYITDKQYYGARGLAALHRPPWPPGEKTQAARYLYRLISLCQNPWLVEYIQDFARRKQYTDEMLIRQLDPGLRKGIASGSSVISVLLLSAMDHVMAYEQMYQKGETPGTQKRTFYYLLSKRQIDELNDFDFDDFEEEQARKQ